MFEHHDRELMVEGQHRGSGVAQWILLLTPLAAALGQQQLAYMLLARACARSSRIEVDLVALVAAGVTVGVAALAWRALTRAGMRTLRDERSSDARARFMSTLTLILAAFSLLLIAAQWMPSLYIHPCQL